MPKRVREGCPEGLVCLTRQNWAIVGMIVSKLVDYAIMAEAACYDPDADSTPDAGPR